MPSSPLTTLAWINYACLNKSPGDRTSRSAGNGAAGSGRTGPINLKFGGSDRSHSIAKSAMHSVMAMRRRSLGASKSMPYFRLHPDTPLSAGRRKSHGAGGNPHPCLQPSAYQYGIAYIELQQRKLGEEPYISGSFSCWLPQHYLRDYSACHAQMSMLALTECACKR